MEEDIWTVKRVLAWIEGYLDHRGDENPRLSAQWLVSEALSLSRMQLFLDIERPLSLEERSQLREWTRRRGTGEPLQYITGEAAFRHITVKVKPGVLIPRPETEVLVSEALALLPRPPRPQDEREEERLRLLATQLEELRSTEVLTDEELCALADLREEEGSEREPLLVADLCTGTGCIACSLAVEHPYTHIIATDVSSEAVALARHNVAIHGLEERIEVLECDLGTGIDESLLGSFDLVISNPPYVPRSLLSTLPAEVIRYESSLALDGGEDGLTLFRREASWATHALKSQGIFAVELHETCLDAAVEVVQDLGFIEVTIKRDLAQRPRVLIARHS